MVKVRYFGAALLLVVLASLSLPGITYATLLCRSDPTVKLSNGVELDIGATINALQSQVINVNYQLHVPAGVSMSKPINTPGWSQSQETFSFVADQKPGQYRVVTTVQTTIKNVSFTATTTVKTQGQATYSITGTGSQTLSFSSK